MQQLFLHLLLFGYVFDDDDEAAGRVFQGADIDLERLHGRGLDYYFALYAPGKEIAFHPGRRFMRDMLKADDFFVPVMASISLFQYLTLKAESMVTIPTGRFQ